MLLSAILNKPDDHLLRDVGIAREEAINLVGLCYTSKNPLRPNQHMRDEW